MMLRKSRLKKELANLLTWKNNKVLFYLILILGLTTYFITEYKKTPEDENLSSGDSVIWGNMEKIDNISNVKMYNYKTRSSTKYNKTKLQLSELEYSFWNEIDLGDNKHYPQGICLTDKYVFITSYSDVKSELGWLIVYDRETGAYLATLCFDENSHMGGIAFDGENLWICNSSKMSLERISYAFVCEIIKQNIGEIIDARNLVSSYEIKNIPSTITFYNGSLWVATHTKIYNSKMLVYEYDKAEDDLKTSHAYKIPSKVQGITFTEKGEVFLSTSYGRQNSSYIKKYSSIYAMSNNVEKYTELIELPPCSEGLVYEDNILYVLFESAGEKYLEGTDGKGKSLSPLDRILRIHIK